MSGLDNPRGLAFGSGGRLYVVEAGRGGRGGPCPIHRNQPMCYGATGALTRLRGGVQERIAVGFPSYISPSGEVTGAHDVSILGVGGAYVTIGFGGNPAQRGVFGPDGALFGTLVHVAREWPVVARRRCRGARRSLQSGRRSCRHEPLRPPRRARRTAGERCGRQCVARGQTERTGHNVGGVPVASGAEHRRRANRGREGTRRRVLRQRTDGYALHRGCRADLSRQCAVQAPEVYLSGFKTAIDLDFGPDGSLYVLQCATGPVFFSGPGQVVRVAPDGSRSVVVTGLTMPTSIVVGPDGALYVTNHGTSIGAGEVVRVEI